VLAGAVALDRAGRLPALPLLKRLGDASYSLYMIHPLMVSALAQLWKHAGGQGLQGWLFVALSLVATSIAGLISHALVEKPLTEFLQYRLKLSKTRPSFPHPFGWALTRILKNPSLVVRN